eukprot:g2039.t1
MENTMDAQGGIVQCITEAFFGDTDEDAEDEEEEEEDEEEEEENERTRVVDMWMNVLHAALTLYSVWSYLLTYVPDNASMMCRASHMIIVPLFKPVAASMWPALMPLVQFAHWNSKRLTKRPEDYGNMSVLPGERPFEYNWLSFLYVVLVAVAFSIYVFATIPMWPLLILFSFVILTAVFGIVFFFMHVPVEFLRGRAFFCCRCRLWCFDKDDLVYMDNDELENLKYLLPKDIDQNLVPDGEDEKRRFYGQYTWDANDGDTGNDELTENINMLTLKSLTVVPIASCIGSLFFAPFYLGEASFSELVDSYMPTFNWSIFIFDLPTFSFHFDFEWNFVFQWPTNLELNFQIPMLVSFGLLLFDYSSKLVWFIYKTTKKRCCKINKKWFHLAAWTVMLPLKFGSFSFIVCEYLWEVLVLAAVVMMVAVKVALYGFLLIIYNLMFCCVPLYLRRTGNETHAMSRGWSVLYKTFGSFDSPVVRRTRAAFVAQYHSTWLIRVFSCFMSSHINKSLDRSGELDTGTIRRWCINNENNKAIDTVDVSNVDIGPEGMNLIIQMVAKNKHVQRVNLFNKSLGDKGISEICKIRHLIELRLQSNHIGDGGAVWLSGLINESQALEILDLSNNNITNAGVRALSKAVERHTSLETLKLSKNSIENDGAESIVNMLKNNAVLRKLEVEGNNISSEWVAQIKYWFDLQNKFKDETCLELKCPHYREYTLWCEALKASKTLKEMRLRLQNVDVTDPARLDEVRCVRTLGKALKINTTLQILNLSNNKISNGSALGDALKVNTSLTQIGLEHNEI